MQQELWLQELLLPVSLISVSLFLMEEQQELWNCEQLQEVLLLLPVSPDLQFRPQSLGMCRSRSDSLMESHILHKIFTQEIKRWLH